jgi:opacity protein-like surface antigen
MRKLVLVVAAGFLWLGLLALIPSPADAELKVSITGNIRLNANYSDVIAQNGATQEIAPGGLPYTAGPGKSRQLDNSQFALDARRTRLQAVVSDDVGMTKLSAFIQMDFDTTDGNANTSNSVHPRMRLAWMQAQTPTGWIMRAGQVRGIVSEHGDNLFGGVGAPDIVDENGHWDQLQNRAAAVHVGWTTKMMGGDLLVGAGVEKAASSVKTTTGLSATTVVDPAEGTGEDVPMFGVAARLRTPLWAVFVRGAAQKHRLIYGAAAPGTQATGAKEGGDTALTGWLGAITAEVTPGPLRVYGQYWYGEGLNRLSGNFSDVAIAQTLAINVATGFAVPPAGGGKANNVAHVRPITTHNWHAGAEYKLTKDLKAVAVYEFAGAEPNRKIFDLTPMSIDKAKFQAVHVGLGYSFWTRFNVGVEYQWGRVTSFGSSEGDMSAINSRLHFYF